MHDSLAQQNWASIYFQKKGKHNQYSQFKTKSYEYQKNLGKLHFLSVQQTTTNQKQIKIYIKKLNSIHQQIKNILSQIDEQMKFMQLQNISSLVESFQELIGSFHHYTIQDKKNKIDYQKREFGVDKQKNIHSCQHCGGSINKINLKKLYDEITTTQGDNQNDNPHMTKQHRKKMISQLDQYDILIAQKQNYLRKVNQILQNKGKIGQISNQDKTYNFLSEYLSKIEKIQQKRSKSYHQNLQNKQKEDKKWEEESYRHILQYIKGVLFQHFVSQCSGPVKQLFKKINIDKLFKSFQDQRDNESQYQPFSNKIMQNHQTQTIQIPQFKQLKQMQRKLQFKTKQCSLIKVNKQELEKKYVSTLDTNRKIQIQLIDLKTEKRWVEAQFKTTQQNLKELKQRYTTQIKTYEEQQKKSIQQHVNQRQRILRISKQLENQIMSLQMQNKRYQQQKGKTFEERQIQTILQSADLDQLDNREDLMSKTDVFPSKSQRKRSSKNKMLFSTFGGTRKNGFIMKQSLKQTFSFEQSQNQSAINESQRSNRSFNLQVQSNVISIIIDVQKENDKNKLDNKHFKLSKPKKFNKTLQNQQFSQQIFLKSTSKGKSKHYNTLSSAFQFGHNQNSQIQNLQKNKRIKISMTSFKKKRGQITRTSQFDAQNQNYRFSKFNRLTQVDKQSDTQKNRKQSQQHSFQQKSKQKKLLPYQVSQRLYKKSHKNQQTQLPFQRVIQNKKQKFYIKKISRQSINYKMQKQKIKQISQILKPYMYNNNQNNILFGDKVKRKQSISKIKNIRQRLSILSQNNKKKSLQKEISQFIDSNYDEEFGRKSRTMSRDLLMKSRRNSNENTLSNSQIQGLKNRKNVGGHIIQVQHIIESQFAYLKAVGFIDFLLKIGKQNKKMVKAMRKIQSAVKKKFQAPAQKDLQLFGGRQQAQHYIKNKHFWNLQNIKQNMMIYNKNDGLSTKIQKYFNLLKRANPQMYGILVKFLADPIFAVYNKPQDSNKNLSINIADDGNFVRDLFNQLQKYHKIKHNQCTHIYDFLDKIGFYKYTYF